MQATAIHDFEVSEPAELGFRNGDKLVIINFGQQEAWYTAKNHANQIGIVPANYIEIPIPSWYKGDISRQRTEQMLHDYSKGAFLVRKSESEPGFFSLSVKCETSVQHFRILADNEHKYYLWNTKFNSLNELIDYYRTDTVSRTSTIYLHDMADDKVILAEALFDFEAQPDTNDNDDELYFKRGDIITVSDDSDSAWWSGSILDRKGFFPRTYVQRLPAA